MTEELFRYVPVHRERDYAQHGWITIARIGNVRGIESVMMEWTGTGTPQEPPVRAPADETVLARHRYDGDPPQDQEQW
jgi:hypothetical protein